eukprot:5819215-Ditylum_brightwellii.AAC.1
MNNFAMAFEKQKKTGKSDVNAHKIKQKINSCVQKGVKKTLTRDTSEGGKGWGGKATEGKHFPLQRPLHSWGGKLQRLLQSWEFPKVNFHGAIIIWYIKLD